MKPRAWIKTLLGQSRMRTVLIVATSSLVILALLVDLVLLPRLFPEGNPSRLRVAGRNYFVVGVNYPWKSYQDFGTGAWGHSGISNPTTYSEVDTDFSNMEAQGVRVVKWRIFNDGRYSPEFDKNGQPTGFDDKFVPDLDAALGIAKKHNIYLVLSLFSSGLWTTDCGSNGMHFGYGSQLMADPARRTALLEKAVKPFLKHVGHNDRVIAYEIIAEPEWGITELQEPDYRQKVPLADVRSFVKSVVAAIHQYTGAKATLESNRPANMKNWRDLGLDFYTTSWYDWMQPYEPLDRDVSFYGMDRPVVLGELPATGSDYFKLNQMLDIGYRRGYAGVFPWSYGGGDKYSVWSEARGMFTSWVRGHWLDVAVGVPNAPLPAVDAPVEPPPYTVYPAQFGLDDGTVRVGIDLQIREGGTYSIQAYLYRGNETKPTRQQQLVGSFQKNGRVVFNVNLGALDPGQRYQVSVGIFSQTGELLKWINGYTNLVLQDGQLEVPELSQQAAENPCSNE